MPSHVGRKAALRKYLMILLGAFILAFGLYNIHERTNITEGGVLGFGLLFQHWFGISPTITNPILDILCYALAFRFLGRNFVKYALAATMAFALFHGFLERFPPLLPDLSEYPFLASIVGGLFVGVGIGLVVRIGGACGGDDALAMAMNHTTKIPIARCYLIADLTVLILSLSYISFSWIAFSLISVTISSFLIGRIQVMGKTEKGTSFVKET